MADQFNPARPVLPGEDEKTVTLREFEQRFTDLRHYILTLFEHERELRETISDELRKALELQAVEVLRRLDELNHAHRMAAENWARSLPREMFDTWKSEHDKWREGINTTLALMLPQGALIQSIDARMEVLEKLSNKITGAFILLGTMGLAGVIALVMGLARIAGLAP